MGGGSPLLSASNVIPFTLEVGEEPSPCIPDRPFRTKHKRRATGPPGPRTTGTPNRRTTRRTTGPPEPRTTGTPERRSTQYRTNRTRRITGPPEPRTTGTRGPPDHRAPGRPNPNRPERYTAKVLTQGWAQGRCWGAFRVMEGGRPSLPSPQCATAKEFGRV